MKKIVALFILSCTLFAQEIIFKNISIPHDLQSKIKQYWHLRYEDNYNKKKLYAMELPYLRYLYTPKEYRAFVPPIEYEKIVFNKIFINKPNIIELGAWLVYDEKNRFYIHDKWIKVGKKWYHRFVDKLIPF